MLSLGFGTVEPPIHKKPARQSLFARSERVNPMSSQYLPTGHARQSATSSFYSVSEYVPIGHGRGATVGSRAVPRGQ